jgi:hypothetical protein
MLVPEMLELIAEALMFWYVADKPLFSNPLLAKSF